MNKKNWENLSYDDRLKLAIKHDINPTGQWQMRLLSELSRKGLLSIELKNETLSN